jgi:superoxide dismutase, Fe-Mn family
MITYRLPELSYDYGALEPHISGRTLELHHRVHHGECVKNANLALERLAEARAKDDFGHIAACERALAFNLSGHHLHSTLWRNLMPRGGGRPEGELASAIESDLGGFDALRRQLNGVAGSLLGSGWGALVWEPLGERLVVTQCYEHQAHLGQAGVPLMVIDGWEHAYYLQHESRKRDHFEALWHLWNWGDIALRFKTARRVDLGLHGSSVRHGA